MAMQYITVQSDIWQKTETISGRYIELIQRLVLAAGERKGTYRFNTSPAFK